MQIVYCNPNNKSRIIFNLYQKIFGFLTATVCYIEKKLQNAKFGRKSKSMSKIIFLHDRDFLLNLANFKLPKYFVAIFISSIYKK